MVIYCCLIIGEEIWAFYMKFADLLSRTADYKKPIKGAQPQSAKAKGGKAPPGLEETETGKESKRTNPQTGKAAAAAKSGKASGKAKEASGKAKEKGALPDGTFKLTSLTHLRKKKLT